MLGCLPACLAGKPGSRLRCVQMIKSSPRLHTLKCFLPACLSACLPANLCLQWRRLRPMASAHPSATMGQRVSGPGSSLPPLFRSAAAHGSSGSKAAMQAAPA